MFGSYRRIEGGNPYETLHDLTGAPCYSYPINQNSSNELFDKIFDAD